MFLSIGTARNLIIFSCPNTYVYYSKQDWGTHVHLGLYITRISAPIPSPQPTKQSIKSSSKDWNTQIHLGLAPAPLNPTPFPIPTFHKSIPTFHQNLNPLPSPQTKSSKVEVRIKRHISNHPCHQNLSPLPNNPRDRK